MPRYLVMIVGFLACAGDKGPRDTDDTSPSESDTDGTDSDSDIGVDTGGSSAFDSLLLVRIDGESEGLEVGLSQFWMGPEGIITSPTLSSGEIEGGLAELELPGADGLELDDDGTGALMGSYVVYVWNDDDGDGNQDEDESISGLAETRLLYLDGFLGEENEVLGLDLGWNAVWFDMTGSSEAILYELDSFPLVLNLQPKEQQSVSGTSDVPDTPADPIRMTALPLEIEITEEILGGLVFDEPLLSNWTASVSGSPGPEHLVGEEGKIALAQERLLVYVDIDESGTYTFGDETLHGVCFESRPVLLLWMDELTSLADAITAPLFGLQVGWSVAAVDPDGVEPPLTLDSEQVLQLVAESDCALD